MAYLAVPEKPGQVKSAGGIKFYSELARSAEAHVSHR